jgi:hypothetical protein
MAGTWTVTSTTREGAEALCGRAPNAARDGHRVSLGVSVRC